MPAWEPRRRSKKKSQFTLRLRGGRMSALFLAGVETPSLPFVVADPFLSGEAAMRSEDLDIFQLDRQVPHAGGRALIVDTVLVGKGIVLADNAQDSYILSVGVLQRRNVTGNDAELLGARIAADHGKSAILVFR